MPLSHKLYNFVWNGSQVWQACQIIVEEKKANSLKEITNREFVELLLHLLSLNLKKILEGGVFYSSTAASLRQHPSQKLPRTVGRWLVNLGGG